MAIRNIKDISVLLPDVIKREKNADEHGKNRRNKRPPEEPEEKTDLKKGKVNIRV